MYLLEQDGFLAFPYGRQALRLIVSFLLIAGGTHPGQAQAGLTVPQGSEDIRSAAATQVTTPGVVCGMVQDRTEAAISEAEVTLAEIGSARKVSDASAADGSFAFGEVKPGAYRVTVVRTGFEPWHGVLAVHGGERVAMPAVVLEMAASNSSVEVQASAHEIAEAQLQMEEKQRVLGVFPNFYAVYAPHPEPLNASEKFRLGMRFVADPVAFSMAGVVAGSEQRADTFDAYGRGIVGYTKRYGAAYTDGLTSTMIGQALLPAVLHQDPRYFVKGTGTKGSRVLYAMASMVICKGDNGHWQPNYSNVLGNLASASISNAYYPSANRGGSLIVSNAMVATAMGAVGGLFQEFLLHRMTPGVPDYEAVR